MNLSSNSSREKKESVRTYAELAQKGQAKTPFVEKGSSYSAAVAKENVSSFDKAWQTKGRKELSSAKLRQSSSRKGTVSSADIVKKSEMSGEYVTKHVSENAQHESDSSEKKTFENTKPDRCKNTQESLCIALSEKQIGYLFAEKGARLKDIHEANGTSNQRVFYNKNESSDSVPFIIFGASRESCLATKEAVEKLVGIARQKEEDARFHYYSNEVSMNIRGMQYIMHRNIQLSEKERLTQDVMKEVSSYLSFEKQVGIEHFTYLCKNDKFKKQVLDLLIDQFSGKTQLIIYCSVKQAPLIYDHLLQRKQISNNIEPVLLVPATKEDRKEISSEELKKKRNSALKLFKNGAASSKVHTADGSQETVSQRILIATDDYARYARTREIPYVNLIVHYSPPKQREWFLFRSETIARGAKLEESGSQVGYQLSLFSENEEHALSDLKQIIQFKKLPHEEEKEYFQKWFESLRPETNENPMVDYSKVEPIDIN